MKKAVKVVGCVATGLAVAGVGYLVGKYLKPEYLEDFDDDLFDDDLDEDLKEVDSEDTAEDKVETEEAADFRKEVVKGDAASEN